MRTLAIGADSLPTLRKEGSTTLKLKVVVLCAVVAVMTAIADGSRPRLFLRPHLLPGLRERCANGDLAGRYAGWRRDARRAIGADLPPEPPVLPKLQPDRNREYARAFRTVRPPTRIMQICALVYKLGGDPEIGAEAEIVTLLEVSRPGEQKQSAVATCTDTPEGTRVRVDCGGRRYDVLFPRGEAPVSTVMQ